MVEVAEEVAEEEENVEREAGVLLQENSISSSDSSREAEHSGQSRLELDQVDQLRSPEQTKVDADISTTDKTTEVAQLISTTDLADLSTESEKVKTHIRVGHTFLG